MADVYTDVGEAQTVDALDTLLSTPFIAWGTGAGTSSKTDTTLFIEASEARVASTASQPAADTLRNVATITADGAKTITNAGLFDASTVGNMIVKGDFTGIALALGESIEFTIDLQFS